MSKLVFCEECGSRNFVVEDDVDRVQCTHCGYVTVLRSSMDDGTARVADAEPEEDVPLLSDDGEGGQGGKDEREQLRHHQ